MGLGPIKNGKQLPIVQRVAVTHEAFCICQQILQGEGLDRNVRDAAAMAIDAYRSGGYIDRHVSHVLAEHAAARGRQDRWGK